ncbi:MAG TPA: cupin domain-containing protein [Candidatus Eisenbacteria bacterium]
MTKFVAWLSFLVLCVAATANAQEKPAAAMEHPSHIQLGPSDLQWAPVPPVLPPGAQMTVLRGDPSKEGLFVIRCRFPANYKIMPHWHPTEESFTVLSGQMFLGMGDTFDKGQGNPVPTQGFASLPPLNHHFAWTESETVIELTAYGPFQIYYVHPTDNPANMASK